MSNSVIKVENLSKQYRLGEMGTGTISHDLNRWWHQVRGKEDPYLKVGEVNDRASKGKSDYVWALRDINFEVKQGEVLGIIGKNGAGKSTLLKLLSRVTSPTTGAIKAKGRIASLLEVGTGFHDELTGRENIFLNGAILGMNKAEIRSKLDEIIVFSGTERYIDTPVKRYSSGMRVRLAFAVAAHLEPEILIVDEVLAVGDAEFQKKAIGKMQEVSHGQGRTVLFVSHNMSSILKLCSRALLLNNGSVLDDGKTMDIVSKYYKTGSNKIGEFKDYTKNKLSTKKLKVRSARLLKDEDSIVSEFALHDEVSLEIGFEVLVPGTSYNVSFELISVFHGVVFTSTIFDEDMNDLHNKNWTQGLYNYKIKVPSSLLMPGEYSVNINSSIPALEVLDSVEEALTFTILDENSPIALSNEGRRGVIMPILSWKRK